MTRSLSVLASSIMLMTCAAVAAETPTAVQVFACNYLEGKGIADLDEATDFFNAQIEKIGSTDLSASRAYLWELYVTNTDRDLLWFANYENLNALGRAHDAINNSSEGQAANAKFDEVVDCDSLILFSEIIYDGDGDAVSDNQAVLESYVCQLNDGKTLDDARAVVQDWAALMATLPTTGGLLGLMRTPLIANTPNDLAYVLVHDDMTQYAQRQTEYQSSGGPDLDARFNEVHNCESGLWSSRQVVPAQE